MARANADDCVTQPSGHEENDGKPFTSTRAHQNTLFSLGENCTLISKEKSLDIIIKFKNLFSYKNHKEENKNLLKYLM